MSSVDSSDSGPGPARRDREPGAEIVRYLTWISRSAVWIGGAGILFSAGLVTVEVLIRKFVGISLGGADEISGYIFAVSTMWALPFALLNRANVRIDVVYMRLPAWLRSFLDVFSLILLVVFVAVVLWHSLNLFMENRANDTRSITPLQARVWIWQGLWILGMVLFVLVAAVLFVLAVAALVYWRHDEVAGLIGSRSSEEEIASETAFLKEDTGAGRPDRRPDSSPDSNGGV